MDAKPQSTGGVESWKLASMVLLQDRKKLSLILENLIENAITHCTEKGSIDIIIGLQEPLKGKEESFNSQEPVRICVTNSTKQKDEITVNV